MNQFKKKSYLIDTMSKATFARTYATNFDEYVGILGELKIPVRVEKESITYFYPGRERGKRGSRLGWKYDKPGLIEAFKANDEKFRAHPELRAQLRGELHSIKENPENLTKKDYAAFTHIPRRQFSPGAVTEGRFEGTLIPIEEIRKARRSSILDYCRRNKIELAPGPDGTQLLKGKEHVAIREFDWINHKNKTQGSLIEFVSAHQNVSLLHAVSLINNNPRLLLLEQAFGEQKYTYKSFAVPKSEALGWDESLHSLSRFLNCMGAHQSLARDLLRRNQATVTKSGAIHLFSDGEHSSSLEWSENESGMWRSEKRGQFKKPFFSNSGAGNQAILFLDPLSFLKHHGKDAFSLKPKTNGVLALMNHDPQVVHSFVGKNGHLKSLLVVTSEPEKQSPEEAKFISFLRSN